MGQNPYDGQKIKLLVRPPENRGTFRATFLADSHMKNNKGHGDIKLLVLYSQKDRYRSTMH